MKSKTPSDLTVDYYNIEQISKGDLKLQEISNNSKIEPNLLTYPFNCIGLLKFTNAKTGMVLNGTAFLISSDLVLTSAQNIFNNHEQCYYTDFYFLPPTLYPKEQISIKIRQYRVDDIFVKGKNQRQNNKRCFGLLKLDKPVVYPQYFKIKYNYSLDNGQISVYGYPKPQQIPKLYGKKAFIIQNTEQTIIYDTVLDIGHNGSPIFIKIDQQFFVIGIHLGFLDTKGVGLLFKKENTAKICQWQREMMISRIKISVFEQGNTNQCQQQYFCYFQKCSLKKNQLQKNWTPLHIAWQLNSEQTNKLIIENNKIIRIQNSLFDDLHRQASSKQPIPKETKSFITFKIIQYGSSLPYDPIYFGISTEKHKKNVCSDGRSKGSLSYVSSPYNFSSGDTGVGSILLDGRQLAYGQDWFIKKGGQLKLQVDLIENMATWSNGFKSLTFNLSSKLKNHSLYLFTSLASNKSCVSWRSNEQQIWR